MTNNYAEEISKNSAPGRIRKFFEQALELVALWKVVDMNTEVVDMNMNMDVAAKKVEVKLDWGSAETWLDPESGKRLHIHG